MNKNLMIAFVLLLLSCGCSLTPVQQAVAKLKAGQNKNEVQQLFKQCRLIEATNEVFELQSATKFFSTNRRCASRITYGPKWSLEVCAIYFDTNNTIIAFFYKPSN